MSVKISEKSKNTKSSELPKVSSEFLKDNQTRCKTNSKSRKKKGGPYSKTDRQTRREEVYRLHFEYGYSALKISELMKINRNTINGDIQYWYSKVVKNWLGHYEYFFDVVLGRPTSYYVKPVWSKRILKVGHNRIILEKIKKN